MILHEHDTVVLTRDLPEHKLCAGDVGRWSTFTATARRLRSNSSTALGKRWRSRPLNRWTFEPLRHDGYSPHPDSGGVMHRVAFPQNAAS